MEASNQILASKSFLSNDNKAHFPCTLLMYEPETISSLKFDRGRCSSNEEVVKVQLKKLATCMTWSFCNRRGSQLTLFAMSLTAWRFQVADDFDVINRRSCVTHTTKTSMLADARTKSLLCYIRESQQTQGQRSPCK